MFDLIHFEIVINNFKYFLGCFIDFLKLFFIYQS